MLPSVLVVLPAPISNIPSFGLCYPPRYIWSILHIWRRYPPSFVCYPPYIIPHFSRYFLFRQPRFSCSFLFVRETLHSPFILLCFFPPTIPASCISCIPFPITESVFDTRFFSQRPLCAPVSDYPLLILDVLRRCLGRQILYQL